MQAELHSLERVASEFAVAVEAFLAKQQLVRERDRLRTVVRYLECAGVQTGADDLFSAISDQLSSDHRARSRDADVTQRWTDGLDLYALHSTDSQILRCDEGPLRPSDMPAGEVLATGKPVVAYDSDSRSLSVPAFRQFVALGFKSICSVPLDHTRSHHRNSGAMRTTDDLWTPDDVEFLVQVANQIAIAVELISYRELAEMKERLATEKLYLEDEIRLDHNIGNMVGDRSWHFNLF